MTKLVKRTAEQRHKLVVEFRRSGLTVHAFCKLHRIGTSTLLEWRREFPEEGAFVPVRIEPTTTSLCEEEFGSRAAGARLFGARGVVLEFATGAHAAWVAEICGRLL